MEYALTPKDMAVAIGVSESSLRRWVDSGALRMYRTKGGHRRIPIAEGLRFIRESGSTLIRPDLLGIHLGELGDASQDAAADAMFDAIRTGDDSRAYSVVMSLFATGNSVASICDGPICQAMHRVGELWKHDRRGILQEHHATDVCITLLQTLHQSLPKPADHAPLAMGGTPSGDVYTMPSLMAGLVLADAGMRQINYGTNTPADLLGDAAVEQSTALVWLSISVDLPKEQLRTELQRLARRLAANHTLLVIGGRHSADVSLGNMSNVILAHSMQQLAGIGRGVVTATRRAGQPVKNPASSGRSS